MFEFAISLNQKRRLPKIVICSWIASCLVHLLLLLVLVENPQLLRGGNIHDFRGVSLPWKIFQKSQDDFKDSRIVTFTKPMEMPSAATLKKYAYDWNKKGEGPPPVIVRWKNDPVIPSYKTMPLMPKVQESKAPDIALQATEMASVSHESVPGIQNPESKQPGGPTGAQISASIDAEKKGTVNLPPPSPVKPEIANNVAPAAIPNGIKPTTPPSGTDSMRVFKDEKQALSKEGSGFFGNIPEGFALEEYANKIIERIKGRWFIPSNLKNSQGRTTVIFYIDKNGRFSGTRIVVGSGDYRLDTMALNAIIQSDPADPLPAGFPGDRIGAKFVFSYNEP
jgi:TonB family protein